MRLGLINHSDLVSLPTPGPGFAVHQCKFFHVGDRIARCQITLDVVAARALRAKQIAFSLEGSQQCPSEGF